MYFLYVPFALCAAAYVDPGQLRVLLSAHLLHLQYILAWYTST